MFVFVIAFVILVAIYLFLIAPRMINKPERTKFMGVHYAHRGLFDNDSDAPENSLRAIQKAVEAGYGIEFDIQLSKDNIPVVFHDSTLKRMCGVEGKIWDYTADELQKMKLASSNEVIPTLQQVLDVVNGQVPLIIEYKMDRVDTKVCKLGNEILKNYQGAYCIESFHPFAVRWYRKNRPDIMRGQLSQDFSRTEYKGIQYWVMTHLLLNVLTRPDFIAYKYDDAKKLSRRLCTFLGALPVAWTIKSKEQLEEAKPFFELYIFDSFIL